MKIGAMNHPRRDAVEEIRWMAEMGLDFIDLTLEPPMAGAWQIGTKEVKRALQEYSMGIVGHTAYYLPFAHPFEEVRKGAVTELKRCMETFAELGADQMNIHPDVRAPMHDRQYIVKRNLLSLAELLETSRQTGVGIMVENIPGDFNDAYQLGELLEPLPDLGMHLDIGHTNLLVQENTLEQILAAHGKRLKHVHLHDNKGGSADLHLPLGAGTLDLRKCIKNLKDNGYDGTITLEVFTPDPQYVKYSMSILRKLWEEN